MDNLATRAAARLRNVRRQQLIAKARWRGKVFFCKALAGQSATNLCINSDLTVSCNCHDVDGSGRLGDLNRHPLREILTGPVARAFRRRLAEGRLPIPQCARCCDLELVDRETAQRRLDEFQSPDFLMVENTVACNLRCVSCPRTQIRRLRSKVTMSLDDVRRVAGELGELDVRRIGYLNLGEPFLSRTILQELSILREELPTLVIGTSTNGMPLDTDEKREAALLLDSIQFSLDGISQETAGRYQHGLDFRKAYENMKALVAYRDARGHPRPMIIWKYLLFRWNEQRRFLHEAIELARCAQVDQILFERTVSPFYGLPWRTWLGWNRDLGEGTSSHRYVDLRPAPSAVGAPIES